VGDDVEPAVSAGRGDLRPEAHARKQVRDEVLELDAVDLALSLFTTKSRKCVSMRSALGASSAVIVAASSLSSGTGPNTSGSTTWLPLRLTPSQIDSGDHPCRYKPPRHQPDRSAALVTEGRLI